MKYFLFGSMFIEELSKHMDEADVAVKKTYTLNKMCNTYFAESKAVRKKYVNILDDIMEKSDADYFIFDLRAFSCFYDISPLSRLEDFINTISKHFMPEKIILIETFHTKWYVMDTQLRMKKKYKPEVKALESVKIAESLFRQKIDAKVISVAQFYFFKKMSGYKLTNYIYEDECYLDIVSKINNIDIIKDLETPNFEYSLKRYLRYYNETILVQAFEVFLNSESLVERFLLDSPADFVENNFAKYLSLKNMNELLNGKISCCSQEIFVDDKFAKLFYAYSKLVEDSFDDSVADYTLPFVKAIVPSNTISWIRKNAVNLVKNGKQINAHNAGYYYALIKGYSHDEALKYVEKGTCLTPLLMDIYGSCISRTTLGERFSGNTTIGSNLYWFHVPPFRSNDEKVYIDYFNKDSLKDRELIVKYQLEGMVNNVIKDSDAEWLLIDLCSIYSIKSYIYEGLIFNDYYGVSKAELNIKPIRIDESLKLFGGLENMLSAIGEWCDVIYEKFKDHIILVDTHYCYLFLGDDDKLYGKKKQPELEKNNKVIKEVYNYLRKRLDCYCIELTDKFFADDLGYLSRSSVHYELSFYREMFKHIENIVGNMPREKVYADYSNAVRIDRIIRLKPKNDIRLLRNYFSNPIDEIVLQLPVKAIIKRRDIILQWYDNHLSSKEEVILDLENREGLEKLKEFVKNTRSIERITIKDAHLGFDYPYHKNDDLRKRKKCFIIHFDGNGADEGSMENQEIIYGLKTPIRKNAFKKEGYIFKGWQPTRRSDGKTGYTTGKTNRFYRDGEQPVGMRRLLYSDRANVMACSKIDKDTVDFVAQWQAIDENDK